ncbi:insulin-like growth factor-binding protein 5a [Denticeps clupeoides]|uniref:Insulin-like growth factor-binding protein 5 n=1 Tax=Denticeps clupeoides TaxID=299321 RepID=A0AAY4B2V0_9TELE|nr:insulin-like growth factor-binding protein 5 [Denticeps clupeoides]
MPPALRTLLVCVLGLSGCLGSYVPCEPCDQKALSMCPPAPVGCQAVKEPGCGCCMTCALTEGDSCGVYTGTCAQGLRCLPRSGEEKPLHALLHGKGLCMNDKVYKALRPAQEWDAPENPLVDEVQPRVPILPQDRISSKKAQAMRKDHKRHQTRLRTIDRLGYTPIIVEKHKPEFGPCRRKLDGIIQRMKDTSRVQALSLYLPNCDKKGFFKHKQCKPSRGRKRGVCWCVDKYGLQMPGTNYSSGNIQCKDFEISSNSNYNE